MSRFRFFTDTHIPLAAIESLRVKGIDVIRSFDVGFTQDEEDITLLTYATSEGRVLITCDYDFEQLAFQWQADSKPHASILYFNMATGDCADVGLIIEWVEMIYSAADIESELFNRIWRAK